MPIMRDFQLDHDLERVVIDGYAFPLGIVPEDLQEPPMQGYTLDYVTGEEDSPDFYSFQITVSHERLKSLIHRVFILLPEKVSGILEIGSRDAYRSMDVFLSEVPIPREQFLEVWKHFEPILLEDGVIGAGANSEEPFVEVFLDPWKGLAIHVPIAMRDEIVSLLHEEKLAEVEETWPQKSSDFLDKDLKVRPILKIDDEFSPDIDELLLTLRHAWGLELNVDPTVNTDEAGRELGYTLWHAVVIVVASGDEATETLSGSRNNAGTMGRGAEHSKGRESREEDSEIAGGGAYCSIWATASSLDEMERLIRVTLDDFPQWRFEEMYILDRVAFDDRPEGLDFEPRRNEPEMHAIAFDPWPPTGPSVSQDEEADESDSDVR